jgi:hypothetical protein
LEESVRPNVALAIDIAPGETRAEYEFKAGSIFRPDVVVWAVPDARFMFRVSRVMPDEALLELFALACERGGTCRHDMPTLQVGDRLLLEVQTEEASSAPLRVLVGLPEGS